MIAKTKILTRNSNRPHLREQIVQSSPWPLFDSFFIPYTSTLSINWPYSPESVLLPSVPPKNVQRTSRGVTDEPFWRMNPVFEAHIMNLDNWSLGSAFSEHFPQWASAVRIKETGLGVGRIMV
jgi:hypothetical protein